MSTDAAATRLFSALARLEERTKGRIGQLEAQVAALTTERESLVAARDAAETAARDAHSALAALQAAQAQAEPAAEVGAAGVTPPADWAARYADLEDRHQQLLEASHIALTQVDHIIAHLEQRVGA